MVERGSRGGVCGGGGGAGGGGRVGGEEEVAEGRGRRMERT